jgi:two-component system, LuxR family, sensor kinase FixL
MITLGIHDRAFASTHWSIWLSCSLAAGVFLLDIITPRGMADFVLYVGVAVPALWAPRGRQTVLVVGACSVLIVLGYFLSPAALPLQHSSASLVGQGVDFNAEGLQPWIPWINRGLVLLLVWGAVAVGLAIRRTTVRLMDCEVRLRSVVEGAAEGIIVIDEQGRIESFNAVAEDLFGFQPQEVIGKDINLLVLTRSQSQQSDEPLPLVPWRESNASMRREMLGRHKDGTIFPIEVSVSSIVVNSRRLFAGIVRDITGEKRDQNRLLQSERLAAVGQAMAGLAHESRNALQRSQACLEMLARRVADRPEAAAFIADIQDAQDDLHNLYEEVREYAAPIRCNPQPCCLDSVVREAWRTVRSTHNTGDSEFRTILDGFDVCCQVDRLAMQHVFRNILKNAIAAGNGSVAVEVRYSETRVGGLPAVCVSFWNDGPPLTQEEHRRIFDAFYTTKTQGTGLGMAIAKRLVEAHGGEIAVGTQHSAGVEILVTVPRKIENQGSQNELLTSNICCR